ncbi:putative Mitochondrial Rho GTPase 1 [Paratrimastix pyriformis]|uniref:Mitochondrial Rho GTPase 1 n=1 Tax=Paratrimastix pyriformis TaxID=342808 RepID=A0ABQ8UR30_9EUKA|nr:putative Mitochondrial Rho GTPase 1 [Paratrimastix pyriformis]
MSEHKKPFRIVLVGDAGVGKSAFIARLVFNASQSPVLFPPVQLPIPLCLDESTPTILVDTSASEETEARQQTDEALESASAAVIMFAADQPASLEHVRSRWVPRVRAAAKGRRYPIPLVIICNKGELRTPQMPSMEDQMVPILRDISEIETCLEVSVKEGHNIQEACMFAQKAVICPTAPLFDADHQQLTPECTCALHRLFSLCDRDGDGILSDYELNEFQKKCFDAPLTEEEIGNIKGMLRQSELTEAIRDNGLTIPGFVYLHLLFIMKGRVEAVWQVLRSFDYDERLMLKSCVADLTPSPKSSHETRLRARLKAAMKPGDVLELTDEALDFLTRLFRGHDKGRGFLTTDDLEQIFLGDPSNPWAMLRPAFPRCTRTVDGDITLDGWLALWSGTAALDPPTAGLHLAYLCYPKPIPSAFEIRTVCDGRGVIRNEKHVRPLAPSISSCMA